MLTRDKRRTVDERIDSRSQWRSNLSTILGPRCAPETSRKSEACSSPWRKVSPKPSEMTSICHDSWSHRGVDIGTLDKAASTFRSPLPGFVLQVDDPEWPERAENLSTNSCLSNTRSSGETRFINNVRLPS